MKDREGEPPGEPSPWQSPCPVEAGRSLAFRLLAGFLRAAPLRLRWGNYCAGKNITADVELIPIQQVNEDYEGPSAELFEYRFVIDMKTL